MIHSITDSAEQLEPLLCTLFGRVMQTGGVTQTNKALKKNHAPDGVKLIIILSA